MLWSRGEGIDLFFSSDIISAFLVSKKSNLILFLVIKLLNVDSHCLERLCPKLNANFAIKKEINKEIPYFSAF